MSRERRKEALGIDTRATNDACVCRSRGKEVAEMQSAQDVQPKPGHHERSPPATTVFES